MKVKVLVAAVLSMALSGLVFPDAAVAQNTGYQPDALVYTRLDDSLALRIYYPVNVKTYNPAFASNGAALEEFVTLYRKNFYGRPIFFSASASPEGNPVVNEMLAEKRAEALIGRLKVSLDIPDSLYVLSKLTSRYPKSNIYVDNWASLRYAEAVVGTEADYLYVVKNVEPKPEPAPEPVPVIVPVAEPEPEPIPEPEPEPVVIPEPEPEPEPVIEPAPGPEYTRIPLFAVKTNLLFDLFTAVNVEVEVPIGKRFSIAGEWIFPDWVDRETNRYCLQSNIKSVEGRYWFGDRQRKEKLTGHFIGAYGQWGDFDFQPFTESGLRCFSGWAAGVSYGYAHSISRRSSLRMEYSIGLGYVWADGCTYERALDGKILVTKPDWQYKFSFIPVPTKAKVSLVWMIYAKRRVK